MDNACHDFCAIKYKYNSFQADLIRRNREEIDVTLLLNRRSPLERATMMQGNHITPLFLIIAFAVPGWAEDDGESNKMAAINMPSVIAASEALGLDTVLKGGITVEHDDSNEFLARILRPTGFRLLHSAPYKVISMNITNDITVREVLDTVLPKNNMSYILDEKLHTVRIIDLRILYGQYWDQQRSELPQTIKSAGLETILKGGICVYFEDIRDILEILSWLSDLAIICEKSVEGHVSFFFPNDVSVRTLLDNMLPQYDWAYRINEKENIVQVGYEGYLTDLDSISPELAMESNTSATAEAGLDTVINGGISVKDLDIYQLCDFISEWSKMDIKSTEDAWGKVSFTFPHDVTIRQLLKNVLPVYDLTFIKNEQGLITIDALPRSEGSGFRCGGVVGYSYYVHYAPTSLVRVIGELLLVHRFNALIPREGSELRYKADWKEIQILERWLPYLDWSLGFGIPAMAGAILGYFLAVLNRRRRFAKLWGKEAKKRC